MLITPRVYKIFHSLCRARSAWDTRERRIVVQGMNYAPEFIGVGKYTTQLAQFLVARGHRVDVIAALPHYPAWRVVSPKPWRWETTREDGVRITRCPILARQGAKIWRLVAPLSFALTATPVVIWRILRVRPHTLLCVEPTLFAAPAALLAARFVGARTVLHVQDLEIDAAFATGYLARPLLRTVAHKLERAVLRRFDAIVTISDAMASRLRRKGVAGLSVTVLRNWIGPDDGPSDPVPSDLHTLAGVPPGSRIVLYAGNLGAKQGLSLLVEAARHLRAKPNIHLVVAGDGPMASVLRAAAASLPNLTLIGLQPAERLAGLLAAADLHVLPQERAAGDLVFPSKLGPILASGRPLVVTADPGSELATWLDGVAKVLAPGDGRALAEAIVAALGREHPRDEAKATALAARLEAHTILPLFEQCLLPRGRSTLPVEARTERPETADIASIAWAVIWTISGGR